MKMVLVRVMLVLVVLFLLVTTSCITKKQAPNQQDEPTLTSVPDTALDSPAKTKDKPSQPSSTVSGDDRLPFVYHTPDSALSEEQLAYFRSFHKEVNTAPETMSNFEGKVFPVLSGEWPFEEIAGCKVINEKVEPTSMLDKVLAFGGYMKLTSGEKVSIGYAHLTADIHSNWKTTGSPTTSLKDMKPLIARWTLTERFPDKLPSVEKMLLEYLNPVTGNLRTLNNPDPAPGDVFLKLITDPTETDKALDALKLAESVRHFYKPIYIRVGLTDGRDVDGLICYIDDPVGLGHTIHKNLGNRVN